jgi:hypothetical protein
MAGADEHWNLITPITAMSEATVQQDHGRAGSVCRVPNTSAVVIHMALIVRGRQRRGTMRFEILEVVVLWFHVNLTEGRIFASEKLQTATARPSQSLAEASASPDST